MFLAKDFAGDLESFNQLVSRWERPIYALAYRTLGREEDARDVVQEAFLRAYRGLRGFKGQAKFSSWLYRIALNLCRDWIRRQRRAPVSQFPEDIDILEAAAATEPTESIEQIASRVGQQVEHLRVADLMSRQVISLAADQSLETAAQRLLDHHIHRAPVVENGRLVGILSTTDLVRLFANQRLRLG